MANTLSFNQIATVLQAIQEQATGQSAMAATDTSSFVASATTTLATGYDPVFNAINQVLSRTWFSVRPYSRKFKGLEYSETEWGNATRKLAIADKAIKEDDRYLWPQAYDNGELPANGDGEPGADMYQINKPDLLQTNFYGSNVWSDAYTIFRDQLDCAFRSPEELGSFISMVQQNISDKLENVRENVARATLVNFIGGVLNENDSDRVVHLLTEYNTLTGLNLTATTVYQPSNYKAFMQWVFSRIAQISDMMTERTELYQTVVNGKHIIRHTPMADQRVYLYAPARHQSTMMALADTYHDNFLSQAVTETVNFWQSPDAADSINVKPSRIGANGSVVVPSTALEQDGVYGVIMDRNAAGVATTQSWSSPTPFNARGGFTNYWLHETQRVFNDHTEKGVVLLLD